MADNNFRQVRNFIKKTMLNKKKKQDPAVSVEKKQDPAVSVEVVRGKGHTDVEVSLKIERIVYVDWIVQFAPVIMFAGDSLTMTWNLMMGAYVNGVLTSQLPFKVSETFYASKMQTMVYCRFTMVGDKSKVLVYEELPAVALPVA